MKIIAIVLVFTTLAFGERFTGEIDWSQVRPVKDLLHFNKKSYPNTGNRIVNGHIANPHQFPYQVACLIDYQDVKRIGLCGGSVLSPNFILTAAHCVYHSLKKGTVFLGAHNITDKNEKNTKIIFNEAIWHENYDPKEIKNDIALIKLSEPVQFSAFIKPIRLATRSEAETDFSEEIALLAGWGWYSDLINERSDVLRFVENPVLTNKICMRYDYGVIDDNQICMSGKGGRGACNGDSGGPMIVNIDGKASQIGIFSYYFSVCEEGYPTVFARVTSYLDWIELNSGVKIPM